MNMIATLVEQLIRILTLQQHYIWLEQGGKENSTQDKTRSGNSFEPSHRLCHIHCTCTCDILLIYYTLYSCVKGDTAPTGFAEHLNVKLNVHV